MEQAVYILHIETTSQNCSVAISRNAETIAIKEFADGYTHIENLHVFIEDILTESKLKLSDLNAVAVSQGPGSYTGLRIGVSAAKGFCFALNIPLIAIDTLQLIATMANQKMDDVCYAPMIDARRNEVFTALYNAKFNIIKEPSNVVFGENDAVYFESYKNLILCGDGAQKATSHLEGKIKSVYSDAILPSARHMVVLAYPKFLTKQFEDVAYFEPFYLKPFFFNK